MDDPIQSERPVAPGTIPIAHPDQMKPLQKLMRRMLMQRRMPRTSKIHHKPKTHQKFW